MLLAAALVLHLIPRPAQIEQPSGCPALMPPLTVSAGFDPAALEELNERWGALGIGRVRVTDGVPAISVVRDSSLPAQAYRLSVSLGRATIASSSPEGAFYAAMTLAQMPQREFASWRIPCATISDRPALPWRVLSDDVSRGPLPTMRYFEERIRTIAAFKMNGYSPYMEHVFVSPTDPLPAPLDGITPAQLRELNLYAARFHVTLIPEQQTFAHMHNTLRLEQYAPAAELPHGFLLAPNVPLSSEYLSRIVGQELDAVPHPPFFHIGSDETATLGLGTTQAYVAQRGRTQAYADHIVAMNQLVKPSGARIMLWDDGIESDPTIMPLLPRDAVVVNWHYDDRPSFMPFIHTIASGGFEQMVAPGDSNWNEIFPDVDYATLNERKFINEGKSAKVLGLFQTVWHDDGETLYEATWYPVLYAAALSWEAGDVPPERFAADFPSAFFGVDDPGYSSDVAALARALTRMEAHQNYQTDPLFWSRIFDEAVEARLANVDIAAVRLDAESVEKHLYAATPPLHANAASVMFLAARRYDALARKFQIAKEVRAMYADAIAHAAEPNGPTVRDLFWSRYWMWEMRDAYEDLAPLYARAWNYESRDGHLAGNLERYHFAAQRAIALGDAFYRATYDGYEKTKTLPPLAEVIAP
jgi:hexosaminidase